MCLWSQPEKYKIILEERMTFIESLNLMKSVKHRSSTVSRSSAKTSYDGSRHQSQILPKLGKILLSTLWILEGKLCGWIPFQQPVTSVCNPTTAALACASNEYKDQSTAPECTCQPCHPSCATCEDPTIFGCITCPQGYQLIFFQFEIIKICAPICSSNQAYNFQSGTCKTCDSACATCFDGRDTPLTGLDSRMCLTCPGDSLPGREFSCQGQKCELSTASVQGTPIFDIANQGDCQSCHQSCQIGMCSGFGSDKDCTACPSGFSLSIPGNTCNAISLPDCLENEFIAYSQDFSGSFCSPCEQNCKTCEHSGARRCLSCDTSLVLLHYRPEQGGGKDCVASCPTDNSTYNEGSQCKIPVPNCAQFDQSNGSCVACNKGFFLRLNTGLNVCSKTILSGKYVNSANIEVNCPANCIGATPQCISNTTCVSGDSLRKLTSNSYIYSTNWDHYINFQIKLTAPCNTNCLTCYGPNSNNCLSCLYPKTLFFDDSCGICPSGQHGMDPLGCVPCEDPFCARCRTFGKRNCLNCLVGYVERGKECFPATTFSSTFSLSEIYKTVPCHPTCSQCDGPRPTQCISCPVGKFIYAFQYQNATSPQYSLYLYRYYLPIMNNLAKTNLNYYEKFNYRTCDDYPGDQCKPGYTLGTAKHTIYLPSGSQTNFIPACVPNIPLCKDLDCLECVDGVFWRYVVVGGPRKICMAQCTDGYYYPSNSGDYECKPCEDQNCRVCTGPGTGKCYLCNNNFVLSKTGGNLGVCLSSCQNQSNWVYQVYEYYIESWWVYRSRLCHACHWSCATCISQTSGKDSCLTCADDPQRENRKIRNILNPSTGASECLVTCPEGKIVDVTTSTCVDCLVVNCSICLTIDSCDVCKNGFLLDASLEPVNRSCHLTCPTGQYQINSTLCGYCHPTCASCSGPSSHECESCNPGKFLEATACVDSCTIIQTFGNSTTHRCQNCDINCLSCITEFDNGCTNCIANYYFHLIVRDDVVVQLPGGIASSSCRICPSNYVFYHQRKCLPCDTSCQTCSDPYDPKKCTSCRPVYVFSQSTGECLLACFSWQYQQQIGLVNYCFDCHQNCKTCFSGTETSCLSCFPDDPANSTDLAYLKIDESKCLSSCPVGYFAPASMPFKCFRCHESCEDCDGFTLNSCTSCSIGKFFSPGTKSCHSTCPDFTYNIPGTLICDGCAFECKVCTGPNQEDCNLCNLGFLQLDNSACSRNCTYNYFQASSSNCEKCYPTCLSCSGPNSNHCTDCFYGSELQMNGTCSCPFINQYLDMTSLKCEYCGDTCASCVETREKCTSCPTDMLLMPSLQTCHIQCPDGFTKSLDRPEECELCHQNCKTCKGPTENDCKSCHLETLTIITELESSKCVDCKLEQNISLYPQCSYLKTLTSKILGRTHKNYSVTSDITLEAKFDKIEDYRGLLESLSKNLDTLIDLSFVLKSNSTAVRRARVLQDQMSFYTSLIIDESSTNPVKPIRILILANVTDSVKPGSFISIRLKPKLLKWENPQNSSEYVDLTNGFQDYEFMTKSRISEADMKQLSVMSSTLESSKGYMEMISNFAIVITFLSAGSPSGPIINLIKLFKLFFRLRLVNQFFGVIIEEFTKILGSNFESAYEWKDRRDFEKLMFRDSRGKLSDFEIPILANFIIGQKIILYIILRIISIPIIRLKKYIKKVQILETIDYWYVRIMDSVLHTLLLSSIFDIVLLTSHQILHQKNVSHLIKNSGFYNLSYCLSCLTFLMVSLEMTYFWFSLRCLDPILLKQFNDRKKRAYKLLENNIKHISRTELDLLKLKIKHYVETMQYLYGSGVDFFIRDMNIPTLHLFIPKYLKFVIFLKTLIFEVLISSLQMLSGFQIYFMTSIQALVLSMLIYGLFTKAFSAWYHTIGDLFIETTVFLFLLLGSLNRFNGFTEKDAQIHFKQYQILMIYLILFTTVVILLQIILQFLVTLISQVKAVKLSSKLEKSIKESKPLDNQSKEENELKLNFIKAQLEKIFSPDKNEEIDLNDSEMKPLEEERVQAVFAVDRVNSDLQPRIRPGISSIIDDQKRIPSKKAIFETKRLSHKKVQFNLPERSEVFGNKNEKTEKLSKNQKKLGRQNNQQDQLSKGDNLENRVHVCKSCQYNNQHYKPKPKFIKKIPGQIFEKREATNRKMCSDLIRN